MACLSVREAAILEMSRLRKSLASNFTMQLNSEKVMKELNFTSLIEFSENEEAMAFLDSLGLDKHSAEKISSVDGVSGIFSYSKGFNLWAELKYGYATQRYEENLAEGIEDKSRIFEFGMRNVTDCFYGCTQSELHEFFRTGAFELIEGRHITPDDKQKVIISEEVATRNNLKIGDKFDTKVISFSRELIQRSIDEGLDLNALPIDEIVVYELYDAIELEVVGIYRINFSQEPNIMDLGDRGITYLTSEDEYAESVMFSDMRSIDLLWEVYSCARTLTEPSDEPDEVGYDFITVFVENPEEIDRVIEDVGRFGYDVKYYDIEADTESYEASAAPLRQVENIANILIIVSAAACVAIIFLVSSMWAKSRKKEMGILMSIGSSRRQIMLQFLIEVLVLCIIAIILASILVFLAIGGIGDMVNAKASPDPNAQRFVYEVDTASSNTSLYVNAEQLKLTYSLSVLSVVITAGILIIASLISVAASSLRTMKLKPRDIFSKW